MEEFVGLFENEVARLQAIFVQLAEAVRRTRRRPQGTRGHARGHPGADVPRTNNAGISGCGQLAR